MVPKRLISARATIWAACHRPGSQTCVKSDDCGQQRLPTTWRCRVIKSTYVNLIRRDCSFGTLLRSSASLVLDVAKKLVKQELGSLVWDKTPYQYVGVTKIATPASLVHRPEPVRYWLACSLLWLLVCCMGRSHVASSLEKQSNL